MGFQINTDGLASFGQSIAEGLIRRRQRQELEVFNESVFFLDKLANASPDEMEELMMQGKTLLQNNYKVSENELIGINDHIDLAQFIVHKSGGKDGSPELGYRNQGKFAELVGEIKDRDTQMKLMQDPSFGPVLTQSDPTGMGRKFIEMQIRAGDYDGAFESWKGMTGSAVSSFNNSYFSTEGTGASKLGETGQALENRAFEIWKQKANYTQAQGRADYLWKAQQRVLLDTQQRMLSGKINAVDGFLKVYKDIDTTSAAVLESARAAREQNQEIISESKQLQAFLQGEDITGGAVPMNSYRSLDPNDTSTISRRDILMLAVTNATSTEPLETTLRNAITTFSTKYNIPGSEWDNLTAGAMADYEELPLDTRRDLATYTGNVNRQVEADRFIRRSGAQRQVITQEVQALVRDNPNLGVYLSAESKQYAPWAVQQMLGVESPVFDESSTFFDTQSIEDIKLLNPEGMGPAPRKSGPAPLTFEQVETLGKGPTVNEGIQAKVKGVPGRLNLDVTRVEPTAMTKSIVNKEKKAFNQMQWSLITKNPRLTDKQKTAKITNIIDQFLHALDMEIEASGGAPLSDEDRLYFNSFKRLQLPKREDN